jgi:hypothetical protein
MVQYGTTLRKEIVVSTIFAPAERRVIARTSRQMFSDEVIAGMVMGVGMMVLMSAYFGKWGLFGAALAFGAAQFAIGTMHMFHGAHANSDISLAEAAADDISWGEAGIRWLGQAVGFSIDVFLGLWIWGDKAVETGFGIVTPTVHWYYTMVVPFALMTVFTLVAVLVNRHGSKVGFIGLAFLLGFFVYFGAAFGTGINGMREIVPMFAAWFANGLLHPTFFVLPLVFGRLGSLFAGVILRFV